MQYMKQRWFIFLVIIALGATSCTTSDPKPAPSIAAFLMQKDTSGKINYTTSLHSNSKDTNTLIFKAEARAPEGIGQVYAFKTIGTIVTTLTDQGLPVKTDSSFIRRFYKSKTETNDMVIFTFGVVDKKGNRALANDTVNPRLKEISRYKLLNAFAPGSAGLNLWTGVYVSRTDTTASLLSSDTLSNHFPYESALTLANKTTLVLSDTILYNKATRENIAAAYVSGVKAAGKVKVGKGSVYIAGKQEGKIWKYAIFRVLSVYDDGAGTAGVVKNEDYIELAVKR
jgi:hypothetical protein